MYMQVKSRALHLSEWRQWDNFVPMVHGLLDGESRKPFNLCPVL